MSDASSTVTYTYVYTDSEPWRYYGEDFAETGPSRVILYGYDRLPIQLVAPPSPDYVPRPKHSSSLDYMPGPEHPPSPIEIPMYLSQSTLNYVADSDPDEDLEEDPEDDQADYPADGEDGDDDPSDDDNDDDTDDEDLVKKPFEDEKDDEEEEEHLALGDPSAVPIVDPVLPARDAEELEADEPSHTPG
uniref:Uncharacterized protein n=1 Tax=Tanacetum cinerariifolium TaxID=118510 RepID=A0A6L2LJ45_TANCI|nr:hypothetical protein [Tanacetum cinerariifolium]